MCVVFVHCVSHHFDFFARQTLVRLLTYQYSLVFMSIYIVGRNLVFLWTDLFVSLSRYWPEKIIFPLKLRNSSCRWIIQQCALFYGEPERREGQTWNKVFKVFIWALSRKPALDMPAAWPRCLQLYSNCKLVLMMHSGSRSTGHTAWGKQQLLSARSPTVQSTVQSFLMEHQQKPDM